MPPIGASKTQSQLKKLVYHATAHDLTVLITGESGCGKELYAQAIHHVSTGTKTIKSDCRLIAATNRNLEAMAQATASAQIFTPA